VRLLGLSAYYHDSAAALIVDGAIVAAAQEERFTRRKQDAAFPSHAIDYCMEAGGLRLSELDAAVFYDKPFIKFERILETYLAFAPRGLKSFSRSLPAWVKEKLFQKQLIRRELRQIDPDFPTRGGLLFAEHHQSHAASAFYPSPFEEALVITLDGVGEWTSGSIAIGKGNRLTVLKAMHFPHSLGLLYSAFTQYCGFRVNSGEYKLMGLAPYGTPKYADLILDRLLNLAEDGSFQLEMRNFDYCVGESTINDQFCDLFGRPARAPDTQGVDPFYMDVAASIQQVTEKIVLRIARVAQVETGQKNLCLAGGQFGIMEQADGGQGDPCAVRSGATQSRAAQSGSDRSIK
jgi:carbamoyltransferase